MNLKITPKGKRIAKHIDKLASKMRLTGSFKKCMEYYTSRELEILLKYVRKNHSILDAGGGYGRLAIPLAKLGFSVTLLEISENLLRRAIKFARRENVKEKIKFIRGDILNLKGLRNQFDVVICMRDVLNYTNEFFEKALDNLCETVKKDGYFVLSVGTKLSYIIGNDFSLKEMLSALIENRGIFEGMKVRLFEKDEIIKALVTRGFKIVEITGDSVLLQLLKRRKFELFKPNKLKFLDIFKKIDQKLLQQNVDFAEHLIIIAKKIKK